jgi:beta-glucosidase
MRDRMELTLPGRQEELVAAVAATGTPLVLVLVAGRPLGIPEAAQRAAAVLNAWVPGDEGPAAITDVLFGDADPGGKLPVTVPPPRRPGPDPLRPQAFGRALTLARRLRRRLAPAAVALRPRALLYALRAPRPAARPHDACARRRGARSPSRSENVGERAGDEVVQLYVRDEEASVTRPVKELRGFRRVHLAAGRARRRVSFRLAAEQLAFTGLDGQLVLEPGLVRVMVGTSSADLPCQADLELTGETAVLARRSRYLTEVAVY